jgi:uncharacterized protein (TIGR00299 family) protein
MPPDRIAHIRLDPLGGAAGDMFVAALLDACPDLEPPLLEALRSAGLPAGFTFRRTPFRDHGLTGSRLEVTADTAALPPSGRFAAIAERIEAAPLESSVRTRALAIYRLLAEAEARVHGTTVDEVHFHELADWDSYADILAAAWLIDRLDAGSWSSAPLPLGGGRVATAHGPLPVPAPATALLLEGLPLLDDGIQGERVTPTGAAIFRHLAPRPLDRTARLAIAATGHGFGTRALPGIPNLLRATLFTDAAADRPTDETIGVLRFEIDDQTAEDLAIALDRLRALSAVRDACQWPAIGKKGRMAVAVQIRCETSAIEQVIDACLAETATIGLRYRIEQRRVLQRHSIEANGTPGKRVQRPGGGITQKADADALAGVGDFAARRRRRREVEEP